MPESVALPPPSPSWLIEIERLMQRSRGRPEARYADLATVDATGAPCCRTIVVRSLIAAPPALVFCTDARSAKVEHLLADPRAELCWYFTEEREQIRVAGDVVLARAGAPAPPWLEREALWRALSLAARASFAWPSPGSPRLPEAASLAEPAGDEPLPTFVAAALVARAVDHLRLGETPHLRTRFTRDAAGGWGREEVWP